jgi:hypothetical protein
MNMTLKRLVGINVIPSSYTCHLWTYLYYKTCQLSCCEVRYVKDKRNSTFLCKLLQISVLIKHQNNSLTPPQWWDFLPKPNILLYVENLPHMLLVFVLSFVKLC